MDPCRAELGVFLTVDGVRNPGIPRSPAFALRLLAALTDSFCEISSRVDGGLIWKEVGGGISNDSAGSSDCESTRGVAFKVPQVINCLTAVGPSSEGVGEGIDGTREKLLIVGDLGRSASAILSVLR